MGPVAKHYRIDSSLSESTVWNNDFAQWVPMLSENAKDIWQYAFTEMFNNAISHSEGNKIRVAMLTPTVQALMGVVLVTISDDGIGIFKKIQDQLGLSNPRHAELELVKGKFTTAPNDHTGEGIFFASQLMDGFKIVSGQVSFSRHDKNDLITMNNQTEVGTHVIMHLRVNTTRDSGELFDKFTSGDGDFSFNKTIVPVRFAEYGDDKLVSRSQAKRLVAGLNKFDEVVLNFDRVEMVGQAFADEVFRVFANHHPHIELTAVNTTPDVQRMINRALATD